MIVWDQSVDQPLESVIEVSCHAVAQIASQVFFLEFCQLSVFRVSFFYFLHPLTNCCWASQKSVDDVETSLFYIWYLAGSELGEVAKEVFVLHIFYYNTPN